MGLTAEQLLYVTGLVAVPGPDEFASAPGVLDLLEGQVMEMFDLDEPGRFLNIEIGSTYYDRIRRDQPVDGAEVHQAIEAKLGDIVAAEYAFAADNARRILIARRPRTEIETMFGLKLDVAEDPLAVEQWDHEAATVEKMRIVRDMQAAALLPECAEVFATCFPALYDELSQIIDREVGRRAARDKTWDPPAWAIDMVKTFKREPLDTKVTFSGTRLVFTETRPAPKQATGGQLPPALQTELETPSQRAVRGPAGRR